MPARLPLMAEGYRSYVVRVRTHHDDPESTQVEVEDLLGGRRRRFAGGAARRLGDELEAIAGKEADDVTSSVLRVTPAEGA